MAIDFNALKALADEKKMRIEKLINYVENRVADAYLELPDAKQGARSNYNRQNGEFTIWVPVLNEAGEKVGQEPEINTEFNERIDGIVRKALKDQLREARDMAVVEEFSTSVGDVISGVVQQGRDPETIYVHFGGKVEGKIPPNEQVKGEVYKHGDRIKAYVVRVEQGVRGVDIILSRTHPQLVRALFGLEVPEIKNRIVEVMGVARDAGDRSKISVRAHRAGVSPKGALIGPGGARARAVQEELFGEKTDIVDFDEDIAKYVASALAPARVLESKLVDEETKQVRVVVPDFQLSLAIGKNGQNARLAARLTGAKIDINPDKPIERIPGRLKPEEISAESEPVEPGSEATIIE